MARITTVVIEALDKGNVDEDFYPIHAWLRDACIPGVRPLFNVLTDHHDDSLKAAALLRHEEKGVTSYELVLVHDHLLQRFTAFPARRAPTVEQFHSIIGVTK